MLRRMEDNHTDIGQQTMAIINFFPDFIKFVIRGPYHHRWRFDVCNCLHAWYEEVDGTRENLNMNHFQGWYEAGLRAFSSVVRALGKWRRCIMHINNLKCETFEASECLRIPLSGRISLGRDAVVQKRRTRGKSINVGALGGCDRVNRRPCWKKRCKARLLILRRRRKFERGRPSSSINGIGPIALAAGTEQFGSSTAKVPGRASKGSISRRVEKYMSLDSQKHLIGDESACFH